MDAHSAAAWLCIALGSGAGWCLPLPAWAQASASEPLTSEQAKEAAAASHRAGVEQYARGKYRDAIALFLEANRLSPSAAVSFNVARCYEQIDDSDHALAWYRDYVRRAGNVPDRARVERRIARYEHTLARKGVQQLTVFTVPSGAIVSLDDNPVGSTPWTGNLTPGLHSLGVTLPGYEATTQEIQLPLEHARDIQLSLKKRADPPPLPESISDERLAAGTPPKSNAPAVEPYESQSAEPREPPATRRLALAPKSIAQESHALATAGWITVGIGGAALGTALLFELLRQGAEHDAQAEPRQVEFAHDVATMHARRTAARVLAGSGGLLALTGTVFLLVNAGAQEREPGAQLGLSCGRSRCMASLHGRL